MTHRLVQKNFQKVWAENSHKETGIHSNKKPRVSQTEGIPRKKLGDTKTIKEENDRIAPACSQLGTSQALYRVLIGVIALSSLLLP